MRTMLAIGALAAAAVSWCAEAEAKGAKGIVREGKSEVLYLDGLADPKRWAPAECTVEVSKTLKASGRPTMHLHIPVDHFAGEKAYPVGWPRMYMNLKRPAETGWTKFERFEFMVHAKMSRDKPPKQVVNVQIHCPRKPRVFYRNLSEIRLGEWVRISIPIREIKNTEEVARLGINISERDYKHGDKLDFCFGAFRLVRSAEFKLLGLKVRSKVVYRGQPKLKVAFDVAGPPLKIARGLPLTVRQGKRVIRTETLPVKTGLQTMQIEIDELKLEPGDYTLVAFDGDPERRRSGTFRVVETPWEERSEKGEVRNKNEGAGK